MGAERRMQKDEKRRKMRDKGTGWKKIRGNEVDWESLNLSDKFGAWGRRAERRSHDH